MFNRTRAIATAAFLTGVFFTPVGSANDLELLNTTIPASACRPIHDIDDERIKLKNGAFIFRNGMTGTASLLCPLQLSGTNMTSYRIYFRDSNRCLSSVNVLARLRYRNKSGQKAVSPKWTSTFETPFGEFCFPAPGSESNTTEVIPLVETLAPGRLYNFVVQITRELDTQKVTFSGIDFPDN
ncbi:MAG: hypothetical protein V3V18_02940 [Methylococcales bacterium]